MFDQRQNERIRQLQAQRAAASPSPRPIPAHNAQSGDITVGFRIVAAIIFFPIALTVRQVVDMAADPSFEFDASQPLLPLVYVALAFVIFMFGGGAFALFTFRKRPRFAWVITVCFVGYFAGNLFFQFFS